MNMKYCTYYKWSCTDSCGVTELEEAYEVFKNKEGKILTTDLPLVSSSLGISLTDSEAEMVVKDATG